MLSLYIMARECAKSPEFMDLYDKEAYEEAVRDEMKEQGLEEGRIIGHDEEKIEIARKMLQDDFEIEIISKYTDLALEEIKNLKTEKKDN